MLVGSQGSGKRALVAALEEFGKAAQMSVLKSELRDHASSLRDRFLCSESAPPQCICSA